MIFGETIIRECSSCRKHIKQYTIASGNTAGARYWTDGKMEAMMLPDQPWLVKCPHCDTLVWLDEQKEVGEIDPRRSSTQDADKFADAPTASTPTFQDYAEFVAAGVSDKKKEHYVRLRTWWAGNDSRRRGGQSEPLDSFEAQNLRAFITLLDDSKDDDRIMKAEALRELGEFVASENLLATEFGDEMPYAVSIIRDLNQKRIAAVAQM